MAMPSAKRKASPDDDGARGGNGKNGARRTPVTPQLLSRERPLSWKKFSGEGLDVDYCRLLTAAQADAALADLEQSVDYYTGELAKVFVFGKWHQIPRQQVGRCL